MQGPTSKLSVFANLVATLILLSFSSRAADVVHTNFTATFWNGHEIVGAEYNELGPINTNVLFKGIPVARDGLVYMGHDGQTVFHFDATTFTYSETAPNDSEFSWPRGAAFDGRRDRFVIVTLGGEGYLYAVTPLTMQWTRIASMQNVDTDSIVYRLQDDRYYMTERLYGGNTLRVLRYTPEGVAAGEIRIQDVPFDIGGAYQSMLIATQNGAIALLIEPTPNWRFNSGEPIESRIYMIDPVANTAALTFRKQWSSWPAPSPAPPISITAPIKDAILTATNVLISARSTYGSFATVTFFADGQSLAEVGPSPVAIFPPIYSFLWTNAPVGPHSLVAVGHTTTGSSTSAPVNVRVVYPRTPPVVQILSPTNNTVLRVGEPVTIRVQAFDPDGNLDSLDVGAENLFKHWHFVPFAAGTNIYEVQWSPPYAGTLGIYARAIDSTSLEREVNVNVKVQEPASAIATRNLQETFILGQSVPVMISARPSSSVDAWAVEEQIPAGWKAAAVDANGTFDTLKGAVKWGPFYTTSVTNLHYTLIPASNAVGTFTLSGKISFNGISRAIGGRQQIIAYSPYHPADTAQDYTVTLDELTAYAAAWKRGKPWPTDPTNIPLSYVTRAGYLWINGEAYRLNPNNEAPFWWLPAASANKAAADLVAGIGNVVRSLPSNFTPGRALTVTLRAEPSTAVQAYAIEEHTPVGWTVQDSGIGSATAGIIRFGPFFDSQERTLTYTLVASAAAVVGDFSGAASFDGSTAIISGATEVRTLTPSVSRTGDGKVLLSFGVTAGQSFVVESATSTDASWDFVATIQGSDSPVELPPIEPADQQRFYRVRLAQ